MDGSMFIHRQFIIIASCLKQHTFNIHKIINAQLINNYYYVRKRTHISILDFDVFHVRACVVLGERQAY